MSNEDAPVPAETVRPPFTTSSPVDETDLPNFSMRGGYRCA
jgi:hypothetical protein